MTLFYFELNATLLNIKPNRSISIAVVLFIVYLDKKGIMQCE